VQARTNLEAEEADGLHDRSRATNSTRRAVEGGEEAVACGVDFVPAEAPELATHGRVVLFEQVAPPAVGELGRACCRTGEVGEKDRCKHTIRRRGLALAGEELTDLRESVVGREPQHVIVPRQLDVACSRNRFGQEAPVLDVTNLVSRRMDDQRRHVDRRSDLSHVDVERLRMKASAAPGVLEWTCTRDHH
jgi:hypothetical protein